MNYKNNVNGENEIKLNPLEVESSEERNQAIDPNEISRYPLTAQDVSERLRISLSTVHHLTRLGKIKGVKIGKQWRYVEEDVENYIAEGFNFSNFPLDRSKGDRRKHSRSDCLIQGQISKADFRAFPHDGTILNMSRGGLLFELKDGINGPQVRHFDPVTIVLFFPHALHQELKVQGQIVYIVRQDKMRLGVVFEAISLDGDSPIKDFLVA